MTNLKKVVLEVAKLFQLFLPLQMLLELLVCFSLLIAWAFDGESTNVKDRWWHHRLNLEAESGRLHLWAFSHFFVNFFLTRFASKQRKSENIVFTLFAVVSAFFFCSFH